EKLTVGTSSSYVCNGAPGTPGTDGESVVMTTEPAGSNCTYGGEKLTVGSNTSYVCNGAAGTVTMTSEPPGATCATGGVKLQAGWSAPEYVCNGSSLTWTSITTATQAQDNFGYVSDAASAITLTLPAEGTIGIGDEIRLLVNGAGSVTV